MFYSFISDDGKIDYPVKSIASILKISYPTAKKIKEFTKGGGRNFTDSEAKKYIKNKSEDNYMIKIIMERGQKLKLF